MTNLYDILEICLQEIENGADVDTVLFRYPEYAEELRPILETSTQAKLLAAADPSTEVMWRGRAKVMQQAAQMREAQATPARRLWSVPLRRAVVSLAVIGVLFVSSTRLVQAASTTLPGDNLYPVKRTWEDVRLLFTFNNQAREALEVEHENERLEELDELFAEGRSARVDFAGTVMSQNGDLWHVSTIPVLISPQTELDEQPVKIGDAIRVRGYTQLGGTVMAERVDLLPAGIPLPDIDDDDSPKAGEDGPEGEQQEQNSGKDSSGEGSDDGTPEQEATPEESSSREFSRQGVVNSLDGSTLVVNGQSMNISGAEIKGTPKVGVEVKVEGYFDANGVFVVTKLEFENSDSNSEDSSSDRDSQDEGSDDNSSDNSDNNSNNNDGDSDNDNDNDNDNDSGSGNDNDNEEDNSNSSGSGSGNDD